MRVALLTRRFDPDGGGTERDLAVTARYLREAGHAVAIYAAEVRAHAGDFELHRVPTLPLGRALRLVWFAYCAPRLARQQGAALVLSFARVIGADVLRSGGGAHISYVRAAPQWRGALAAAAMRAAPYHRAQVIVERRGFRWPNLRRVIAVSNLVRDDLIRQAGLAPEKVVTLYNGVDLARFSPARNGIERGRIRSRFGVPAGSPLAIFVGNGFARKGLRYLVEAWPQVERDAHLLVVGNDRAISFYRRAADRLGIGARIHFAGPQAGIDRIFHGADALAFPSIFEPFGNVVMEAMASGLPALTSIQAGVSELLPDEMRPFLVHDPTNPREIAERMNALLAAPAALGASARAAAEKYPWARYGGELVTIVSGCR